MKTSVWEYAIEHPLTDLIGLPNHKQEYCAAIVTQFILAFLGIAPRSLMRMATFFIHQAADPCAIQLLLIKQPRGILCAWSVYGGSDLRRDYLISPAWMIPWNVYGRALSDSCCPFHKDSVIPSLEFFFFFNYDSVGRVGLQICTWHDSFHLSCHVQNCDLIWSVVSVKL